ncbi:MAG: hypothetical protein ABI144_10050 [Gallionella sp.]
MKLNESVTLPHYSDEVKARSIFLSDIQPDTRGCQADRLLDFLRDCVLLLRPLYVAHHRPEIDNVTDEKQVITYVFNFEDSVIHAARDRGLNGVICGHIHSTATRKSPNLY